MTPDEHKFFITMFMKQYQQLEVVIDILKSRGLLQGDDPLAFASARHADTERNAQLFFQTAKIYTDVAKTLGIETGLPPLEPSAKTS
jgi:hypothetical protein